MIDKPLIHEVKSNDLYVTKLLVVFVVIVSLAMLAFGFTIGFYVSQKSIVALDASTLHEQDNKIYDRGVSEINNCVENSMKLGNIQNVSRDVLFDLSSLCISLIFNSSALDDYRIRRIKYERQYYAEGVTLWMVVAITISGVMLAALQLLASYRLAVNGKEAFSQDSNIALEQGKVSLKSSITGLFILIISFAFFLVYVLYIYTITEANLEKPQVATSQVVPASGVATTGDGKNSQTGLLLQSGGLGAPPNVAVKQDPSLAGEVNSKEIGPVKDDGMVDPTKAPMK